MCMYDRRLQIPVSQEQKQRLEREAERSGRSISSLVREAVDARFPTFTREERLAAVERIRRGPKVDLPEPEELGRLIDEGHTEEILRGIPGLDTRRRGV